MTYCPLNVHTHLSFLQALSKPKEIAKRLADYDISSCCITDYDLLAGSVQFYEACNKNGIKPLLGTKILVKHENESGYFTFIARNKDGWKELMGLSAKSYSSESQPNISLDEVFSVKDILCLGGYNNSLLYNSFRRDSLCEQLKSNLGEKFVLQVEQYQSSNKAISDEILSLANKYKVLSVAGPRSLYVDKKDFVDYQVLLASHNSTSVRELESKLANTSKEELVKEYFELLNPDLAAERYSEELLKNTNIVSDMCETYNILNKPNLPKFDTPNGFSDIEYLRELCREGWKRKVVPNIDIGLYPKYIERIKYELSVIDEANLSSYFLIVQDYVNWAKNQGWLVGHGRGCFLPDTRVKMSDGHYKAISLINIGDVIVDAFGNNEKVYDILEYNIDEEIIEMEFENGKVIRCTKDHKFLTKNREWVEAQFLNEDDDIIEV